jgi:hypothetical protein
MDKISNKFLLNLILMFPLVKLFSKFFKKKGELEKRKKEIKFLMLLKLLASIKLKMVSSHLFKMSKFNNPKSVCREIKIMTNNYSKQPNKKLKKCYRVSYN